MAVVTPDGVVGKIVEVFPSTAQVLLINDKESGVGALFADSRTHGVVKGSGDPDPRMDYVVNDEKVKPGERASHFRRRSHFPERFADRHGNRRQTCSAVSGDPRAARRASGPPRRCSRASLAAGIGAQENRRRVLSFDSRTRDSRTRGRRKRASLRCRTCGGSSQTGNLGQQPERCRACVRLCQWRRSRLPQSPRPPAPKPSTPAAANPPAAKPTATRQ